MQSKIYEICQPKCYPLSNKTNIKSCKTLYQKDKAKFRNLTNFIRKELETYFSQ